MKRVVVGDVGRDKGGGTRGRESFLGLWVVFPGTATGTYGPLEAQPLDDLVAPCLRPIRLPATDATTQCIQLALGVSTVDMPWPVPWASDRPVGQKLPRFGIAVVVTPGAGPAPCFRALRQIRPNRVAFHVTQHGVEMIVRFDWKRLEAALVKVPGARSMVMGMPALGMRNRKPTKELGNLLVGSAFGPDLACASGWAARSRQAPARAPARALPPALAQRRRNPRPSRTRSFAHWSGSGYGKPDHLR